MIFPPGGGGIFKQNQGKFLCSILAYLQVTYALFRFWEGDERCFVASFRLGARWYPRLELFIFVDGGPGASFSKRGTSESLRCTYCGRSLSFRSQAGSNKLKY